MIHEAFKKSEIVRRYFEMKGEKLTNQEAVNRWRMIRNVDLKILKSVIDQVYKEQKQKLNP